MAKKKPVMRILKKGQRCKEGWTSIEIKVGKVVRRACVRGKVQVTPSKISKALDWSMLLLSPLDFIHH